MTVLDSPSNVIPSASIYHLSPGRALQVLVDTASDLLRQVHTTHILRTVTLDAEYRQVQGWQQPTADSLRVAFGTLRDWGDTVSVALPARAGDVALLVRSLSAALEPQTDLVELWNGLCSAAQGLLSGLEISGCVDEWCSVQASEEGLDFQMLCEPGSHIAAAESLTDQEFLAVVQQLARQRRGRRQLLSLTQLVAERAAFALLAEGHRPPSAYQTWGTSGFRTHQTYMSVTDPGIGHLDGTLRDYTYLEGVIVHIEHLERAGHPSRTEVEPYRIPFPQVVPQIRLLLGDDAPSSSYVGRPVFEGTLATGMLKTVHTVAAACSELFASGLTECKIAIEGMTATEAVHYMQALKAAVRRDPSRQVLSAAFNLNTPLIDDRPGRKPVPATTPEQARFDNGQLGIELAYAGGFDKVTWDGTADTYPSRCVLEQLSERQALTLVHHAHELGLLTYFSAGFRFNHLADAVVTGVDGVGIGGAQILRYMDKATGHHGPFLPTNIEKILRLRNASEESVRGRAAALLARLDRQFFELSITPAQENRRQELFALLSGRGVTEDQLASFLTHEPASEMTDEADPLLSWVHRLKAAGANSLLAQRHPGGEALIDRLSKAARQNDRAFLHAQLIDLRHTVSEYAFRLAA